MEVCAMVVVRYAFHLPPVTRLLVLIVTLMFPMAARSDQNGVQYYSAVHFGDPPLKIQTFLDAPRFFPLPQQSTQASPSPASRSIVSWLARPLEIGQTPQPIASFAAISNGAVPPPDTSGAVGVDHLMAAQNGVFEVQDKHGTVIAAMTNDAFWSPIGRTGYYDPRVIYDRFANRWVIVEAQREATRTGLALAASRTDDPSGLWDIYLFPLTDSTEWYDSPQLGFNEDTVVISALATHDPPQVGQRREIYLLPKSQLYTRSLAVSPLIGPPNSSLTPITVLDRGVTANYLLDAVGGTAVQLYQATSAGVALIAAMNSPTPWSDASIVAPQHGSSMGISTNDTRIANAVLRNGKLWFVQTVFLPAASPTHSSLQWWKTTATGQVLDFGRIDDTKGEVFAAFPSIAVNRQEDVVIGFSQFSAQSYASAAYVSRSAGDPPGGMRAPIIARAGDGTFVSYVQRWGDYSSTVADPDELTFWTIQEYASTPLGRFGTWWAHVPATAPAFGSCGNDAETLCLASNRFAVAARWDTGTNHGVGQAVKLTADTGYFWFFGESNVEVIVKVLDACATSSPRFWVFGAGLTNVHVFLDVVDTKTGAAKTYENPYGIAFKPIQDTSTFAVCP
jgi:hypothetical protein